MGTEKKIKMSIAQTESRDYHGNKTTYLPIPWSMLPILVSDQPVSISVSVEVLVVLVSALVPHKKIGRDEEISR
jgi:hypothetical protein